MKQFLIYKVLQADDVQVQMLTQFVTLKTKYLMAREKLSEVEKKFESLLELLLEEEEKNSEKQVQINVMTEYIAMLCRILPMDEETANRFRPYTTKANGFKAQVSLYFEDLDNMNKYLYMRTESLESQSKSQSNREAYDLVQQLIANLSAPMSQPPTTARMSQPPILMAPNSSPTLMAPIYQPPTTAPMMSQPPFSMGQMSNPPVSTAPISRAPNFSPTLMAQPAFLMGQMSHPPVSTAQISWAPISFTETPESDSNHNFYELLQQVKKLVQAAVSQPLNATAP